MKEKEFQSIVSANLLTNSKNPNNSCSQTVKTSEIVVV